MIFFFFFLWSASSFLPKDCTLFHAWTVKSPRHGEKIDSFHARSKRCSVNGFRPAVGTRAKIGSLPGRDATKKKKKKEEDETAAEWNSWDALNRAACACTRGIRQRFSLEFGVYKRISSSFPFQPSLYYISRAWPWATGISVGLTLAGEISDYAFARTRRRRMMSSLPSTFRFNVFRWINSKTRAPITD